MRDDGAAAAAAAAEKGFNEKLAPSQRYTRRKQTRTHTKNLGMNNSHMARGKKATRRTFSGRVDGHVRGLQRSESR